MSAAHFPDVESDAAAAVVALPAVLAALSPARAFPASFVPTLGVNVFAGKERVVDDDTVAVFCQSYPGESPSLSDDDVETPMRVRFLVRGGLRSYTDAELVARLIMSGLHLRRNIAATQTTTTKPTTYMDVRVLDSVPQPAGENANAADRFAFTALFLYAD
jgi:hypothetical protein